MRRRDAVFEHIILFLYFKLKGDVSFIRIFSPEGFRHDISRSSSVSCDTICIEDIIRRRLQAIEIHVLH